MASVSQISLFKVFMAPEVSSQLEPILQSGYVAQGKKVDELELRLQEFFNYPYILTLNSATSGLTLALRMLNLQAGDEVITTALTCTATNWPILANGLSIRWADVDPKTCNISVESVKANLSEKTKAIMVVHWGGYPVDLDGMREVQDYAEQKYGFRPQIIEDCAHAFGAKYKNRFVGTTGNMSIFSLQAIKHLTCGDGGLIFLPSKEEFDRSKLLRWFGIDRERRSGGDFRLEPDIPEWGHKFHMNDINATIGLSNLPYMKKNLEQLRDNAQYYRDQLADVVGVELLEEDNANESAYWIFTIKITGKNGFIPYAKERGIMVSQVHNRNDNHSCVKAFKSVLPNVDYLEKKIVCIPAGWWLTSEEKERVLNTIKSWCEEQTLVLSELTHTDNATEFASVMSQLNGFPYDITQTQLTHRLLEIHKSGTVVIGKLSGKIVCTGRILIESKFGDPVAHIEDIVVDEVYRDRGFGRQIVKYLSNFATTLGCYKTVLNAKYDLIPFYKSCGFIHEGVQMVQRKKKVWLLYAEQCKCFRTMMQCFSHILTKHNIPNEICTKVKPEYDNDNNIWFCIWEGVTHFPKRFILYNLDPLRRVFSALEKCLADSGSVVTKFVNYCTTESVYLDTLGVANNNRFVLPFGYAEFYESQEDKAKDIDVLFFGGISDRRINFFNMLSKELDGKTVMVCNSVFDQKEKNDLIHRAKIILSVAAHDTSTYKTNDLARMSEVLSNKGFMICEPVGDEQIEDQLSRYISYCQLNSFVAKINYFLDHNDERALIANIAYDEFKKDFNLERDFMKIIF